MFSAAPKQMILCQAWLMTSLCKCQDNENGSDDDDSSEK